jgi:DMSO/TMAO reductase YedYZ heme-binding membrane subunit
MTSLSFIWRKEPPLRPQFHADSKSAEHVFRVILIAGMMSIILMIPVLPWSLSRN